MANFNPSPKLAPKGGNKNPITNYFSTVPSPKKAKGAQMFEKEEKKENNSPKVLGKTEKNVPLSKKRTIGFGKKGYHDFDRDDLVRQRRNREQERLRRSQKIASERIDGIIRSRQRDTSFYRKEYPGMSDDPTKNQNLQFYKNELSSNPDGDFIDNIHKKWWGDYRKLEVHHGYIQWLFPIRESGMNYKAKELQPHEAQSIKSDPKCQARVVLSYKMMLDFYGLCMVDEETGQLERAENWKERFTHLNRSFHNYLRITRILKCLGELGLEKFKRPFVETMLKEIITEGTVPNSFESCVGFWITVIRDDKDREELINLAKRLCDEFNGIRDTNDEKGDSAAGKMEDEDDSKESVIVKQPQNDGEKPQTENKETSQALADEDDPASRI